MRHAKSSWDDPQIADAARPLSPRGRATAAAMRTAMQGLGLAPDLVLVSPAKRTMETLELLEPWEETPLVERLDALYLATHAQLLSLLHGVAETVRSVLLVGHNPGLHELGSALAAASGGSEAAHQLAEGFPTGALAEFSFIGPWRSLSPSATSLTRFLTPRDLAGAPL